MTPCVSIVVPVYNAERYLTYALDSIENQTLEDIEIVCVNDGSTDNSSALLASYREKDDRIIIVEKSNAGYGAAINDGIAVSRGKYIGIVEPDDFIDPDMYLALYQRACEAGADVVKSDFYSFNTRHGVMRRQRREICPGKCYYGPVFDATRGNALFYVIMTSWTGIYRRSFLEDHRIRHNETPGASFQDNGFWWQVFTFARRVTFLNRAFYHYREDNQGSSIHSSESALRIKDEYDFILDFIKKDPARYERQKYIYGYFYFDNLLARLTHVDSENRPRFAAMMRDEYLDYKKRELVDLSLFPPFMIEEFEAIAADPEHYDPADYPSVEEVSWRETEERCERTEILRDSCSPYAVTSTYPQCIVA